MGLKPNFMIKDRVKFLPSTYQRAEFYALIFHVSWSQFSPNENHLEGLERLLRHKVRVQ
jgi:hypothetical protein